MSTLAPSTPPAPSHQPLWPKSLGVISIVLACLSLLGGIMTLLSPTLNRMQFQDYINRTGPGNEASQFIEKSVQLLWIQIPATLLLAFLLVLAGISLLRRQQRSRTLHQVWAGLKIVLGAVLAYLNVMQSQESVRVSLLVQADDLNGMPEAFASGMMIGTVVAGVFAYLFAIAYPVFLLIWFQRAKIKNDLAGFRP